MYKKPKWQAVSKSVLNLGNCTLFRSLYQSLEIFSVEDSSLVTQRVTPSAIEKNPSFTSFDSCTKVMCFHFPAIHECNCVMLRVNVRLVRYTQTVKSSFVVHSRSRSIFTRILLLPNCSLAGERKINQIFNGC